MISFDKVWRAAASPVVTDDDCRRLGEEFVFAEAADPVALVRLLFAITSFRHT
jgi:hypothetical protein